MTAQWLILTAAAGAILLALCAMFWALALDYSGELLLRRACC